MTTVGGFFDRWLELHPRSPETWRTVRCRVRPFVVEHDRVELAAVSPLQAAEWCAVRPGQARYLRCFFNDAMATFPGELERNPFAGVRAVAVPREGRWPSTVEVGRLLGACAALGAWGGEFRRFVAFGAFSGPRMAEALACEVRDVVRVPRLEVTLRRPKRVHGRATRPRPVFVPGPAAFVVECGRDVGPLFVGRAGGALGRDGVYRAWSIVCAEVGVAGVTPHGLRHHCATWMLDAGASVEDVAVQLHGTFDPREVIGTYGHPSHDAARGRLAGVLGG